MDVNGFCSRGPVCHALYRGVEEDVQRSLMMLSVIYCHQVAHNLIFIGGANDEPRLNPVC